MNAEVQQRCEFKERETRTRLCGVKMCTLSHRCPKIWPSVCMCVSVGGSNRGLWWGLLTDAAIIGMGSQDVSEPLTCPLALSSLLSPHIDHPSTHHWSGNPSRSTHTHSHTQIGVAVHVCVRRKVGSSWVFNFTECSSTGPWVWVDASISVIRNYNACYIILPIIKMYSTFPPICRDVINNVNSSISYAGIS